MHTKPYAGVGRRLASAGKYLFLLLFALVSLYPFIWVLISSFKDNNEIYSGPFSLPPSLRLENYREAWGTADISRSFSNSLLVCVVMLAALVLITSMASYVLTRVMRSRVLTSYLSLGIMIPLHALLIPTLIICKQLNLTDNLVGLMVMYTATNISFSMFIMNGFIAGIPRELDEAATVDGCSKAGIFFRIILPVSKPGIATVATLAFLNGWNDLVFGLVLISNPLKRTLAMGISALKGTYVTQYGLLCAGFVVSILPVVVMYLLLQKQVIKGMTAGAVKG